jgi:hypothetical protein
MKDLAGLLDYDFLSINKSREGFQVRDTFKDLLKLTSTENDVELFFTIYLQEFESIRRRINPNNIFLTKSQIDGLIGSKSGDISSQWINKILKYFFDNPQAQFCAPFNFYSFFQESLRECLLNSLSSFYCSYHEKLFKNLDSYDSVVTFNYDELCDFTLFGLNKLNAESFAGLGFADITFPREPENFEGTTFLKLHGSFNWWTDISNPFKDVYYNLESQNGSTKRKGNSPFRVILPYYFKENIYYSHEIYRSHIMQFKNKLIDAKEIVLVGKNFNNADSDLNQLIKKWTSSNKKTIDLIDPSLDQKKFVDFHCSLFNAKFNRGWRSFEDFYVLSDDA